MMTAEESSQRGHDLYPATFVRRLMELGHGPAALGRLIHGADDWVNYSWKPEKFIRSVTRDLRTPEGYDLAFEYLVENRTEIDDWCHKAATFALQGFSIAFGKRILGRPMVRNENGTLKPLALLRKGAGTGDAAQSVIESCLAFGDLEGIEHFKEASKPVAKLYTKTKLVEIAQQIGAGADIIAKLSGHGMDRSATFSRLAGCLESAQGHLPDDLVLAHLAYFPVDVYNLIEKHLSSDAKRPAIVKIFSFFEKADADLYPVYLMIKNGPWAWMDGVGRIPDPDREQLQILDLVASSTPAEFKKRWPLLLGISNQIILEHDSAQRLLEAKHWFTQDKATLKLITSKSYKTKLAGRAFSL
ncbi:hypothetical protein ACYPKM_05415 [Pseudomonas aeruginosa]